MATAATPGGTIRFGAFELDVRSGELRKNGIRLPLQGRPIQILSVLLENPGQLVTRDELRQRLWPADTFVDFDHALHNCVARLREVLGDSAEVPRFIETLPRRGYRYVGPAVAGEAIPLAAAPPPVVAPQTPPRRRWFLLTTFVIAVALTLGLGGWLYRRSQSAESLPDIRSLAVLPLSNLSGDPSQEYFADGMTDELITELAQVSSLRVISRTSVMHYKSTAKTAPQIARELGVDAVLEGSVARSGNRVRITAQLIAARADRHLWASSYEGEVKDVLGLQDAVALAVVKQIRLRLSTQEKTRLSRSRPVNPEAHEAYLRGLYYWNKRGRAGLEKAIDYFNRAIALDPNYALPYAGLAQCYVPLSYFGYMRGTDAQAKVATALQKALELDDSLAEAHTALGSAKSYYDYDWEAAEQEFRRAIELNPSYATAHQWYAQMLGAEGRGEEALQEHQKALALDPLSLIINSGTIHRLYLLRRYGEAAGAFREVFDMDPGFASTHWNLGFVLIAQKQFKPAIEELRKAADLLQGNALVFGALGYAYAASGNQREAQRVLRRLENQARSEYVDPYALALVHLGLGEKGQSFVWLQRAVDDRDPQVTFAPADPILDDLRTDPRFSELLRRMKLAR